MSSDGERWKALLEIICESEGQTLEAYAGPAASRVAGNLLAIARAMQEQAGFDVDPLVVLEEEIVSRYGKKAEETTHVD